MDEQNNRNYILKHRKILKNPIYKKPLVAHLFDYCLMMANYAEKKMIWNNKEMIIERGSFITGRKIIADETGLSEQNVRSGLHTLYMMGMLQKSTTKSTNRFTYLTVCKYNDYQIIKDEANQETNQPATSSQPQLRRIRKKRMKRRIRIYIHYLPIHRLHIQQNFLPGGPTG